MNLKMSSAICRPLLSASTISLINGDDVGGGYGGSDGCGGCDDDADADDDDNVDDGVGSNMHWFIILMTSWNAALLSFNIVRADWF